MKYKKEQYQIEGIAWCTFTNIQWIQRECSIDVTCKYHKYKKWDEQYSYVYDIIGLAI